MCTPRLRRCFSWKATGFQLSDFVKTNRLPIPTQACLYCISRGWKKLCGVPPTEQEDVLIPFEVSCNVAVPFEVIDTPGALPMLWLIPGHLYSLCSEVFIKDYVATWNQERVTFYYPIYRPFYLIYFLKRGHGYLINKWVFLIFTVYYIRNQYLLLPYRQTRLVQWRIHI